MITKRSQNLEKDVFKNRIKSLKKIINLDSNKAYLTIKSEEVNYFVGFRSSNAFLLITSKKIVLLTDRRYTQQVKNVKCDVDINYIEKNFLTSFKKLLEKYNLNTLLIELRKIPYYFYDEISKIEGLKIEWLNSELDAFYSTQDEISITKTKKALKITEQVFQKLINELREGITERDLQAEIKYLITKSGFDEAFDPIVLFGKNSAFPHGVSGRTKLKKNSAILLDFGAKFDGYFSDFTRTIFFGYPDSDFIKNYNLVNSALDYAIENIQVGKNYASVHQAILNYFAKFNVEKYFTHALGHGLGIYLHNRPLISINSNDHIDYNQLFTIEPGLYFEGKYGIRIEDIFLIKNDKCERLNKTSRKLIVV